MKYLFIILILFPLTIFSQSKYKNVDKPFFIGLNFSPDYSYRHLTQLDKTLTDEQWNTSKNLEDSLYISKYGYTTGVAFGYQINKKLSIETGLIYSNKGYKTISINTIYDYYKSPEKAQNILSFYYLSIPVKASLTFFDSKFQLIAGLGTTVDFLLKTTVETIPDNPTTEFPVHTTELDYAYNKTNLTPMVSIGLKYNITDRMSLRAEPTFRYSVLNIDDKSYRATYFWSAGLNVGVYIGL